MALATTGKQSRGEEWNAQRSTTGKHKESGFSHDRDTKMPDDLMGYDLMARNALRGVVRAAMQHVSKHGLPGEHHFFIAFNTRGKDVVISPRLLEKYPQEMTIVVQHQYWELEVLDDRFSIGLSFNNIPEKLTIPYKAVNSFFDPHVQFGLQFEREDEIEDESFDAPPEPYKKETEQTKDTASDKTEKSEVVSLDSFRKKK